MRKVLFGVVILSIIGVVGFFLIPVKKSDEAFKSSDIFKAVPNESAFILRGKQLPETFDEFMEGKLGRSFRNLETIQSINSFVKKIDSLQDKSISNLLRGEIVIAGVVSGGGNINQLYLAENKDFDLKFIKKGFGLLFGASSESKNYEENVIYKFNDGEEVMYMAYCNPIIVWSKSEILIETSIRTLKSEVHLSDKPSFRKLIKTADLDLDANLFVNYNQIGKVLNLYTSNLGLDVGMTAYGDWAELDLRAKSTSVMLNGFSIVNDSISNYLSCFKNEKPQALGVSAVLPENVGWMQYFGFSNFKSFKEKYNNYLNSSKALYQHQKNVLNINKKHTFSVENDFYNWIGDEMAVFSIYGEEKTFYKNSCVILKSKDIEQTQKCFAEIHKSTGVSKESIYENFKINDLGLRNFFKLVLGDQFRFVEGSKYVLIEDYVIFANDESALKHIVNSYLRGKTLIKNIQFNKFYEQFSSESNLFYYLNFRNSRNFFDNLLNDKLKSDYLSHRDSVENLQAIGWQINANDNLFFTNSFMNYNVSEEAVNVSLIEVKLDTTYSQQPWVVKNHYTKEKEILVLDDLNQLYLINNVGKVLWKRSLKHKIIGDVAQVDRYKNDKLQYMFVTERAIHQIDRNGKDVSGFPVNLKKAVSQGITVLDYDNNRNYRILITQNQKLHNYNISGEKVKGWQFKPGAEIANAPVLLQVGKKDYIVFAEKNGKVRALNRRGEDRIKLTTTLPANGKKYYGWMNNSLSTSGVLCADSIGTIHFVKLSDGLETFSCKVFDGEFKWGYQDATGNGIINFVAEEENKITVFKNNKKRVFEISDLNAFSNFGVQSFIVNKNEVVNVITNKEDEKVYCYSNKGELLPGFPIDGVTPALISDVNGDNVADLIIGDKLGSLYIYNLDYHK